MITIKISGPAASGKTTLANAIVNFLNLGDKKVALYDDFQGPEKVFMEKSAERIAASGVADFMIFVGEDI